MSDEVLKTTLGNGLRVVTEPIVGSRSTAVGAWFAVGSRDEAPALAGASHFLEHLLFKGTDSMSARDVAEAIDGVGGDMNAFTAREHTAFYTKVPSTALAMSVELLFNVVSRPAFRAADIEAERSVIAEELVAALDAPDDVVHIALYDALFKDHPLGREVLGDTHTIASISREEIANFHQRWYRPANLVIAAAGDVDHGWLVEQVAVHFGELDEGVSPVRNGVGPTSSQLVCTPLPVEQLHVAVGWRALDHSDPARYAHAVANQILGGSPSSRLFQSIREDQALAYTVFSSTSGYFDTGSASLYAATTADRGPTLLGAIDMEIARFVDDGVTQAELDRARTGFEGALVIGLEDNGSRMARIATGEALRGEIASIDEFLERLAAVTVDDVNAVVRRVYGGERVTSLVGAERALAICGCG